MIVQLQKIETTIEGDRLLPRTPSAEPPMIADPLNISALPSPPVTNRRLRNWLVLANIVAWVAIIVVVRFIFF
jgi:hypothetical protein